MLFFFSKGPAVQCKDFREREAQKNISAFVGVEEHRKKKAEVNLLKGHIHKIRTGWIWSNGIKLFAIIS